MNNPVVGFIIIMACSLFGLVIGLIADASGPNREQEAINKGYARYHPKTGEWEWIEQSTKICGQEKSDG